MPSPLAHASLALLIPRPAETPPVRFWALVAVFLLLPDADIAVGLLASGDGFADHGSWSHSFVLAPIAGLLFMGIAPRLVTTTRGRAFVVGTALYASHVALDALTHGRGVGMFWPIVPERIQAPMHVFSGVRHSEPFNFAAHARTLAEELLFAAVVAAISVWIARSRQGARGAEEAAQ